MPYNEAPSQSLVENVRAVYRMEMLAGKSAKTVFCINKAEKGEEDFHESYREEYVQKIMEDIS